MKQRHKTLNMDSNTRNYWWLNTNIQIWDVSKFPVGHKEPQETHGLEGTRRRKYSYFGEMVPGDMIIGYETSPTRKFVAIYRVTKSLHTSKKGNEVVEFEIVEKLDRSVGWEQVLSNPGLKDSEPMKINNRGSIFKLQLEEYKAIVEMVQK